MRADRIAAVLLAAGALLYLLPLRASGLAVSDDGWWLVPVLWMRDGEILYRDVWTYYAPLVHHVYAWLFALTEPSVLAARTLMAAGLIGGYGTIAYMGLRFLTPTDEEDTAWMLVARTDLIDEGGTLEFTSPAGERIVIARRHPDDLAESFIALSSVCPHLGCRVFWEPQNNRFFCPCHLGAFDPEGRPTAGPPLAAHQSLPEYPLKIERGLLYIQMPVKPIDQTTYRHVADAAACRRRAPQSPTADRRAGESA